jgi:hypothetical protein
VWAVRTQEQGRVNSHTNATVGFLYRFLISGTLNKLTANINLMVYNI